VISNNSGMGTIERDSICRALLPFVTVIEFLASIPSRKKIPCNVVMKINQAGKDVTVRIHRALGFIVAALNLNNFVACEIEITASSSASEGVMIVPRSWITCPRIAEQQEMRMPTISYLKIRRMGTRVPLRMKKWRSSTRIWSNAKPNATHFRFRNNKTTAYTIRNQIGG
jgi:hypothetical protein